MTPGLPILSQRYVPLKGLQKLLHAIGFDPGPADGSWGPRTRVAVQDFQQAHGLEVTGRPDFATISAAFTVRELVALAEEKK